MATPTTTPSKKPSPSTPRSKPTFTKTLLARAHSPITAARIHAEKIAHKPLILHAATEASSVTDARAARRAKRAQKLAAERRRRRSKPVPLTAKEKRKLCVYEIPKAERKWSLYAGLNAMWQEYMREVLGVGKGHGYVTPAAAGPKIASADMHGAEVECVRSGCVSRVGVRGIVVRDTKFTFVVITPANEIKVLPKEESWFRIEVGLGEEIEGEEKSEEPKNLVFELQGEQFKNRAPERAKKKFKIHLPPDL